MRGIFGVLSLLLVLGIMGVVVKKQLAAPQATAERAPTGASSASSPQQTQQQFKQALDAAMRAAQPPKDSATDEK